VTRREPPTRRRRGIGDPYGLAGATGLIGPAIAVVALIVIGIVTLNLMNGQLPIRTVSANGDNPAGPQLTPAPPDVVIVPEQTTFPGSIVYAKAGNIWIQTASTVKQLTNGGTDSMPAFAADGSWVYFIRVQMGHAKFPAGGFGQRAWYDLSTPLLMRVKPDGSGEQRLLTGQYRNGGSTWFYWLREPTPSPDGNTIAVISDGPNPLQSDIVLQTYDIQAKKLTALAVSESLHLGHQDPAWRADGRVLLYVRNGRQLTSGAPQIFRYDPRTRKSAPLTGPGYLAPSFSPDGRFIAATKTGAFGSDVVILDGSGKELLRVSNDDHSFSPAWSPAGNAIAYLHLQGKIVDLRMAVLDSSTGRWTVTKTVDLTKVSGLDGASRPSWFVPASEMPAPTPGPSDSGSGPSASDLAPSAGASGS
jgi:Tol biopolymer transport system component